MRKKSMYLFLHEVKQTSIMCGVCSHHMSVPRLLQEAGSRSPSCWRSSRRSSPCGCSGVSPVRPPGGRSATRSLTKSSVSSRINWSPWRSPLITLTLSPDPPAGACFTGGKGTSASKDKKMLLVEFCVKVDLWHHTDVKGRSCFFLHWRSCERTFCKKVITVWTDFTVKRTLLDPFSFCRKSDIVYHKDIRLLFQMCISDTLYLRLQWTQHGHY